MHHFELSGLSEVTGNTTQFATSHILRNVLEQYPDLFNKTSNLILTDLDSSYDLSWSALPARPECENAQQQRLRESMVEQWVEELDLDFERSGGKFNGSHKRQFLTTLLYSIWNGQHQGPFKAEDKTESSQSHFIQHTKSIRSWVTQQGLKKQASFTKLEKINPAEILSFLLYKVQDCHKEKYGDFLIDHGLIQIKSWMWEYIRPDVLHICENGRFELDEFLALGGDICDSGPGIYMHVIWEKTNPARFYLYIGQSLAISERIKRHLDPWYREKHPSLHYYVLASGEMESKLVILTMKQTGKLQTPGLLLNLLEMWTCLLFQTLTARGLRDYLPENVPLVCPGNHLNVALPLHQRLAGDEKEQHNAYKAISGLYHSNDPIIRRYYQNLRQSFLDLKNSPNPILREYYMSVYRKIGRAGSTAKKKKTMAHALSGLETAVKESIHRQKFVYFYFSISHYSFKLPKTLVPLKQGAKIHVQCFLLQDSQHPNAYATHALPSDPAARLGIKVQGKDMHGDSFALWLPGYGEQTVKQMNTFVDDLEGVPIEETEKRERRYLPVNSQRGREKKTYTS